MTTSPIHSPTSSASLNPTYSSRRKSPKRLYKLTAAIIILLIITFTVSKLFQSKPSSVASQTLGQTNLEQAIDYNFSIPIKTKDGDTIDQSINYNLLSAELTEEIVLKGQKATAVNDRIFLILNIKLSNPSESTVRLDTRNYIRLSVNSQPDKLAPSIHNDPVEIQPISDQPTRLGFSINKSDQNPVLYIGEISGTKQEIPLNFSN